MLLFCREKKLVKLRKLHHDKAIKYDFLHSFLKMAPLGTILKVVEKVPIYIFVEK